MNFLRLLCMSLLILWPAVAAGIGPTEPCSLITGEEARQILGEEVAAPRPKLVRGMAVGRSCLYRTAAPLSQRGGVGTIRIIVYDTQTMKENDSLFDSPRAFFEKFFKARRSGQVEVVPGLGDEAKWTPGSDTLHFLVGDLYLTLEIKDLTKMSAPDRAELDRKVSAYRKDQSLAVARKYILPRLKAK